MKAKVYRFGPYRLDTAGRSLSRNGQPVEIQSKSFDVLVLLVENAGEVFTKERLIAEGWQGVHVSESSVEKQVSLLREILGNTPNGKPYIKTIPRQGYRFGPIVKREQILNELFRHRWRWLLTAAALLLILAGTGIWKYTGLTQSTAEAQEDAGRSTLAVLDLRNLNGRPDLDWISTAVAEMVTADLTVTGRFRRAPSEDVTRAKKELPFKKGNAPSRRDLTRLAANIPTDLLVTGSYALVQDQVRIDATVFDVRKKAIVASASEVGSQGDLLEVVSTLGRSLGEKLQDRTPSEDETKHLQAEFPANVTSQQLYYEALARFRAGDALTASRLFQELVNREPGFALGHSALADALSTLGYETQAVQEAKKAWDLSGKLGREQALSVEGQYDMLTRDSPRAIRVYGALCSFFPDDFDYGIKLASAQAKLGNKKEAYAEVAELKRIAKPFANDPRADLAEASVAETFSEYDREERAAHSAENKSRTKGASLQIARAELMESWALDNLGRLQEAANKAQDAKRIFVSLADRGGEARAWKNLGDAYLDQDNLGGAHTAYENAASIFRGLGWQSGVAIALNNLGYVVKDEGDLTGAGRLFGESLTIARSLADLRLQALALNGVAVVLKRQGNLSGARTVYEEALDADQKLGDKGRMATVENNLAIDLQDQGDLDEAKRHFKRALSLFQEMNRPIDVAMVDGNLGQLALLQGNLAEAEGEFKAQLDFGERLPQPKQSAYGLFGLGEVALFRDDLASACDYFKRSLGRREQMHETETAAESRLGLAEVALEQNDAGEAEHEARLAEAEFEKEKQVDLLASARGVLARALLKQHDGKDAVTTAELATKLEDSSEDHDIRTQIELDSAEVFAGVGRYSDAQDHVQAALREAERFHFRLYHLEAQASLGRIELASGRASARMLLRRVEREATKRGLLLIAKQASVNRDQTAISRR
jgi:eukaryotic-like serine/threonine-protein kinase